MTKENIVPAKNKIFEEALRRIRGNFFAVSHSAFRASLVGVQKKTSK